MQKTLPILWYILAAFVFCGYMGGAVFGAMAGMGPAAFAQAGPMALIQITIAVALGVTYTLILRVAPNSAAGVLGTIHWGLALLGSLLSIAGFTFQQSLMTGSMDIQNISMIMGLTYGASSVFSFLGWIFMIGAAATALSSIRRAPFQTS